MNPSNDDTQPVSAIRSGLGCLKRIVQLLFVAVLAVGIFAFGYATASGVEILAPANAIIKTAIASFPDSVQALWPQSLAPAFTTQPADAPALVPTVAYTPAPADAIADTPVWTHAPTDTLVPTNTLTPRPIPTATDPLPTSTPQPVSTDTPTFTPVPTDTPTNTPLPTNTLTHTPIPTVTELPPTRTPLPTATPVPPTDIPPAPACYRHPQVWVTGDMNVRQLPSINAQKVDPARAGERFDVLESRQGDSYCWLRINRGWMAVTGLVSATEPQRPAPSSASGGVGQALANLNALVVAPENRCSHYDSDSYPYSQSVEGQIVARMGGRIYGPYTGTTFSSTRETDIEHIVAKSEAHDSGLCSAGAQTRRTFSNDLLNLTLASPSVNRHQKSGNDFAEWRPALNQCWFADTIIKVKLKYRLTVDSREKAALESTLRSCASVAMVFSGRASQGVAAPAVSNQQTATRQQAQTAQQEPANNQNQQPAGGDWRQWDTNGNGRITCAEARAAGLSLPVRRGHPAYPHMRDSDGDGQVCE